MSELFIDFATNAILWIAKKLGTLMIVLNLLWPAIIIWLLWSIYKNTKPR